MLRDRLARRAKLVSQNVPIETKLACYDASTFRCKYHGTGTFLASFAGDFCHFLMPTKLLPIADFLCATASDQGFLDATDEKGLIVLPILHSRQDAKDREKSHKHIITARGGIS
jgi:hypothetical protein